MVDSKSIELMLDMTFRGHNIKSHVLIYNSDINTHGSKKKKQILCLHGFASSGEGTFKHLVPYLKDYELVLVDWIGYGRTTRLLGFEHDYGYEYMGSWLLEFIKTAIKKKILHSKFDLFAVSMSGLMTMRMYHKLKPRLKSIIFLNPAGFDVSINRKFAIVMTNPLLTRETFIKLLTSDIFWIKTLGLERKHKEELVKSFNNKEIEVYVKCINNSVTMTGSVRKGYYVDDVSFIKCPVLMIASENDNLIINRKYVDTAKKHGWNIEIISHDNHELIGAKPKEVASAVNGFLK